MIRDSFWSHDYLTGVEALVAALRASIAENKQFIFMVQERSRIERACATSLAQLSQTPSMRSIAGNGPVPHILKPSSLQSAMDSLSSETVNEAVLRTRIASDLDTQVCKPLQKWCAMYQQRVEACSVELHALVAQYTKLVQAVAKQRLTYYEHCRKYEDSTGGGSPKDPIIKTIRMLREKLGASDWVEPPFKPHKSGAESPPTKRTYTIAGLEYTSDELADLLRAMMPNITLVEYKVPLLGSYYDVCTGSMLATAARKHLKNDSFAYAEKFGQSLVDLGFIKPVGQISNRYQSTHNSHYQWQPLALNMIKDSTGTGADSDSSSASTASDSTNEGPYVPPSAPSGATGATGATDSSEEDYLQAVLELESYRCNMEQDIERIYGFLDRLELDRNDALKKAMGDYIRVAFKLEDQRAVEQRLAASQQQIDPAQDLQLLLAKYQTGPYVPTVTVFEGYFSPNPVQTFGVDLNLSQFFIPLVLDWLKSVPVSDARDTDLWCLREPITEVNKLRTQINTGKPFNADATFRFFTLSVVVSTFCQYLLELPESLVSFLVYERLKQLYAELPSQPADTLASVLIQVPQRSSEALERVISYLRLVFDTKEEFVKLSQALALLLVRPRAPSVVNMDDVHPQLFVMDLLQQGPQIFGSLKARQSEIEAAKGASYVTPKSSRVGSVVDSGTPQTASPMGAHTPNGAASPVTASSPVRAVSPVRTPSIAQPRMVSGDDSSFTTHRSASVLIHNTRPRPLSLSMRKPEHRGNGESPPTRGLGIQPMLPISVKSSGSGGPSTPKSDLSTASYPFPDRTPARSVASPARLPSRVSPPSMELKLPKTRQHETDQK